MILTKKQLEDMANCANHGCDSCTAKDTVGGACQIASAQTALAYREMLERLEWCIRDTQLGHYCPICGKNESKGHAPNCELAALLRADDTTDTDTAAEAMARVAEHDGTADKMARGE